MQAPATAPNNRIALVAILLLSLLMGLAFQGDRGLWDPDEGRYANVALGMVDSGDYLVPRRHHESLHVTKPPLTYWAIAASTRAFGHSEWALRLPMALGFVLTVALVFQLGRIFVPARPWLPALVYLGSPLPFLAASTITTDTLLTCVETAAVLAYARHRFAHLGQRWLDAMWCLFGLAFMVKGPPALLPLLAILAWEWRCMGRPWALVRPWGLAGFLVIGLGWFAWIVHRNPELLGYFIGHEVVDRVASGGHDRHGEWYGAFLIYLPTLALGALPWSAVALWRRWLLREQAPRLPANARFLWFWLGLPLVVFFLARSRLPFYLLPLFVPMSLLVALSLDGLRFDAWRGSIAACWLAILLATKALVAHAPSAQDARALAGRLEPLLPTPARELVFVDGKARYGLHFYLGAEIEKVSLEPLDGPQPPSDAPFDQDLAGELGEFEQDRYFLVPEAKASLFSTACTNSGWRPVRLGSTDGHALFMLEPDGDKTP